MSLTNVTATQLENNTADLSYENEEALSGNSNDFSTLADEINSISQADEIKLTKDYSYNIQNDEKYSAGINITKDNLIINGQGHTIDGSKNARIFNIKSNNVTLKNIILINANANSHGGAIYWTGSNGNITDSTFKDCYSSNSGGAVLFRETAYVKNSKFTGNHAYFGGGINTDSKSQVINCIFEDNFATYLGGGIYALNEAKIINSTFTNNKAGDGGGVYLESEGLIDNSIFNKNIAIGYGGAITSEDMTTIKNSRFIENTAKYAGAIYIKGSINLKNNEFEDNSADLGGAISSQGLTVEIYNNEFKYNYAKQGSSLYLNAKSIKIENISFVNNQTSYESEIYIASKNSTLSNLSYYNITKPQKEKENINNETTKNTQIPKIITKKKTTIVAKSKVYKLKTKTKAYSIILKSGKTLLKYKRITLKLKGKTYSVKTNKKGKAIFKIKLKKIGRFKSVITFKGDKTYKSAKKIVYIKIK